MRDGSIRSELQLLVSILHFGEAHKVNGRPLLTVTPLMGVQIPQERNPMRPVATEERYQRLLEVADEVESLGRFRCVLSLARECGRRINAIVNLRATDVLLSIRASRDRPRHGWSSDRVGGSLASRRNSMACRVRQNGV